MSLDLILPLELSSEFNVGLVKTAKFFVFELRPNYIVHGACNCNDVIEQMQSSLLKNGCCSRTGILSDDQLKSLRQTVQPVVRTLVNKYDPFGDEFVDVDFEDNGIVRLPRIGIGKHNVHFDPHESDVHHAIQSALQQMNIPDGIHCSLRETGFSLTRPNYQNEVDPMLNQLPLSGEMEYHSDGAKGEYTVLICLDEITSEMGSLNIVAGSHVEYEDGVGHTELVKDVLDLRKLEHCYRPGCPLIFDARLIHGVNPNTSNKWRVLIWCIFDSY